MRVKPHISEGHNTTIAIGEKGCTIQEGEARGILRFNTVIRYRIIR